MMAFDRTDPADLAALKTEITTDPTGMSYSSVINNTKDLLSKLNDPAENVGGDTINRPTEELDISDIASAIDAAEFAALSEFDKEWVKMFITRPENSALRPYQQKFLALFGAGSATRTAALGLRSKAASRAEVLFGVNTVIDRQDLIKARAS